MVEEKSRGLLSSAEKLRLKKIPINVLLHIFISPYLRYPALQSFEMLSQNLRPHSATRKLCNGYILIVITYTCHPSFC